ncbi:MAG TPA: 50S ribosomal protein L6 [Candidatus Latescibacteria bacterium]|nr:50S ribosomal protein L6 [Gemmatimonadaceae bacterium]HJP30337.1 50S ribosomal protein L6 [Candidatus Latescibacterota bacterium]
MSRVGKQPIPVPTGVDVSVQGADVTVKGPKGQLAMSYRTDFVDVAVADAEVRVTRRSEVKQAMALHGLTRSLVANAVQGVTEGYVKHLDLFGVGYRAEAQGRNLTLNIGFSHQVEYVAPEGIEITIGAGITGAQARIVVSGIDKQMVGQVAADIRQKRKPDPYKGKGIRYENEIIHWKAGKSAVT